jgi:arylsulfatase A-like enzyme/Tfp pilus assembly protein PilF
MNKKKTPIIIVVTACIACVAAVVFYLSRDKQPKDAASNVLVITLDTTRADRIGIYGHDKAQTPNIDDLARKGAWFERAFSSVPLTLPSHCSIFTGTSVLYHQVRNNGTYFLPEQVETLAEILQKKNYSTSAFIASFTLDSRFGLNKGFHVYNDNLVLKQTQVKTFDSERPAELVFNDFSTWFHRNYDKTFFSWVHFYDPHLPYSAPEPYKSRFQEDPYDGEIAYMDEYVGKIISLLKEKNALDNTLIVIVGDHGEAFGEHGEVGHGFFCYEESLAVPLIFYSSKGIPENKKVSQRVNLSDVMPTILDYLDIETPKYIQGESLMPYMTKNIAKIRSFYIESVMPNEVVGSAVVKGIVKGNYKYLDLPKPELYHLAADPMEKENLYADKTDVAHGLHTSMKALETRYNTLKAESKRTLSAEETQKLRSLGYLSSTKKTDASGKLPDPKDKIAGWNENIKGSQYYSEGKIEEAIRCLKRSIELDGDFSEPYALLAFINFQKGNIEEAETLYKKGMEVNPDDYLLRIEYIKLLIFQKKFTDALRILKELETLKLIAYDAEIFNLIGTVNSYMNNTPEAVSYFKKALKVEPENQGVKLMLARTLNVQGKFDEGLAILLELEKNTPDNINVLLNIAMTYGELKDYEHSKSYFEKILRKDSSPIHLYYYAVTLSGAGEYEEAVKKMTAFTNTYTQDDERRREALQWIEAWSKAANTSDTGSTAAAASAESADEMFKKAFALQRSGKAAEALDIYLQLEKTNHGNFNLVFNMAMVYGMLEKYETAEEYFKQALKIKPVPVVYFNYAFIMSKAGKYDEAIEKMKKFLELYPNNDDTRRNALQFIENMKALKKR